MTEGTAGCQAMFEELSVRGIEMGMTQALRWMMVDAYCLQHPERYCVSAKSLYAHLTGLCCALEYGGKPAVRNALQRWQSGKSSLVKPELPAARGPLTIADIRAATNVAELARGVEHWAKSTWEAYAALQPLARNWVQAALAKR